MSDEKKPGQRPISESERKQPSDGSSIRSNQDEPRRRPDTVNKGRDDSSKRRGD